MKLALEIINRELAVREFVNERHEDNLRADVIDAEIKSLKKVVDFLNKHFVSNNEERVAVCCSTCKHVGKFGEDSACNNCFQNYNKWEQAN